MVMTASLQSLQTVLLPLSSSSECGIGRSILAWWWWWWFVWLGLLEHRLARSCLLVLRGSMVSQEMGYGEEESSPQANSPRVRGRSSGGCGHCPRRRGGAPPNMAIRACPSRMPSGRHAFWWLLSLSSSLRFFGGCGRMRENERRAWSLRRMRL